MASSGDIEAALRDLGRQLKARRKATGLTQEQLARQIGYARPTLSMAETGRRRSPDFWRRADDELSAGRTFTNAYGDIEAMTGARLLPPLRPGDDRGSPYFDMATKVNHRRRRCVNKALTPIGVPP